MKKGAILLALVLSLFGCKKTPTTPETTSKLSVLPNSLSFIAAGGTQVVNVSNSGSGTIAWTAVIISGGWFSISPDSSTNSGSLTVTCSENAEASTRAGAIRITANGATNSPVDVGVNQAAAEAKKPELSVTPATINVPPSAGVTTLSVVNTGGGTLNWSASTGAAWLHLSPTTGTNNGIVSVNYDANNTGSVRTTAIQVVASGASGSPVDISVTQAGSSTQPILAVLPSSRTVASSSGTATFTVSNSGSGTMNWTAAVSSGNSWLTIQSGASGANAGTITVAFTQNPDTPQRTGIIRVTANGAIGSPADVSIIQSGAATQPVLSVTPSIRSVSSAAGTTSFDVANTGTGNMNWIAAVTSGNAWLSVQSGSTGINSGSITLAYAQNGTSSIRSGTVHIAATGAIGSPIDVTVSQAGQSSGPILSVTPSSRSVSAAAGTTTFQVSNMGTGDMNWTAAEVSGGVWISIQSGTSGLNSGTITVAFTEYTQKLSWSRVGTVRVTANGAAGSPIDVNVIQSPPPPVIGVSPESLFYYGTGGSQNLRIFNDGGGTLNWTVSVQGGITWLSVSPSSGTDIGDINVSCSANAGPSRSGNIIVSAPSANPSSRVIPVTQAAVPPVMTVSPTRLTFNASGGSQSFNISFAGGDWVDWTVVVQGGVASNWVQVSPAAGTGNSKITVNCNPVISNGRSATITVTALSANPTSINIEVLQEGRIPASHGSQ